LIKRLISSSHSGRQPVWFRFINGAWSVSYPLGTKTKLDKDELIKAARKATGLHDLGKDFNEEPFERMLISLNEEARLHPIGRFITRQRILNLLNARLRAEHWFKKLPEILEQPLYPVTVIVGLQRTGTTKLHRLLASDPENRTLLSWEAINPVPLNGDIHSKDDRIKIAHTSEKALQFMAPGFFAIHPVEHQAPEEDVLLLDVSFMSTTIEATAHVPSYAQWLETIDQSAAYAYSVKLLKFLQWQRPAKRWVLKTPHHMEFLDLVSSYFGNDTQFVWLHRDIHECIPSFLSMVAHSRMIFSRHADRRTVAEHWMRKCGHLVDKALEFRLKGNNDLKFTDICYPDFIKNPMNNLRVIYQANDLNIDVELEQRFLQTERDNPKGKYGNHRYRIEDFGFVRSDLDRYTSSYQNWQKELFTTKKQTLNIDCGR
jgi:hypothetical protein